MLAIVDYGLGNIASIVAALRRIGADPVVTSDPTVLARASKIVLPGVGAFDHGAQNLVERGLVQPLTECALERRVPVLGICLGAQLLMRSSDEGTRAGLGWIDARVVGFRPDAVPSLPHIGWNQLRGV